MGGTICYGSSSSWRRASALCHHQAVSTKSDDNKLANKLRVIILFMKYFFKGLDTYTSYCIRHDEFDEHLHLVLLCHYENQRSFSEPQTASENENIR